MLLSIMARLIRHVATGPYRIDPQDFPKDNKPIFICACGLSKNLPYCDGTHKTCRGEEPGIVYMYDDERSTVIDRRPEARESPEAGAAGGSENPAR